MSHEVRVVNVRPTPTAVVVAATTWKELPRLWGRLLDQVYEFLKTSAVQQDGHNVMVFLDDVPNVEVGVAVDAPFASDGPVVASTLPSGDAATTVHRGPYDRLGEAHDAIHAWCAAQGREPTRTRWEVYGDWHEDPEQLETEVFWLLR